MFRNKGDNSQFGTRQGLSVGSTFLVSFTICYSRKDRLKADYVCTHSILCVGWENITL